MARWYEIFTRTTDGRKILSDKVFYRLEAELLARAVANSASLQKIEDVVIERVLEGEAPSGTPPPQKEEEPSPKNELLEKKEKAYKSPLQSKEATLRPAEQLREEITHIPRLPHIEFDYIRVKVVSLCQDPQEVFGFESYSILNYFFKGYLAPLYLTLAEAFYNKLFMETFLQKQPSFVEETLQKTAKIQATVYKGQSQEERYAFLKKALDLHQAALSKIVPAESLETLLERMKAERMSLQDRRHQELFFATMAKQWKNMYYVEKIHRLCDLMEKGRKIRGFLRIMDILLADLLSHSDVIEKVFTNQRDVLAWARLGFKIHNFTFQNREWDSQLLRLLWQQMAKSPLFYARAHLLRGISVVVLRRPTISAQHREDILEEIVDLLSQYPYKPLVGKVGYNELIEALFLRAMDTCAAIKVGLKQENLMVMVSGRMKNLDPWGRCEFLYFLSTSQAFAKLTPSILKAIGHFIVTSQGLSHFCAHTSSFVEKKKCALVLVNRLTLLKPQNPDAAKAIAAIHHLIAEAEGDSVSQGARASEKP